MRLWKSSAACAFLLCPLLAFASADADKPWIGTFTAKHVVAGVSPDNSFSVLTNLIDSAVVSIHASVYELDNLEVGRAFDRALDRGVEVSILLEGTPVPKLPDAELFIASKLAQKGAKIAFYDRAAPGHHRTFKFVHAKYTVVDDSRVAVGSANYGVNGHPTDNTFGNREWEVVLDDPQAAQLFGAVFQHDRSLQGEWAAYGSSARYRVSPSYQPTDLSQHGPYQPRLEPLDAYDVAVKTVFAPDNALENSPILGALSEAQRTVDVEQLSFEAYWGEKPYNPERQESPLVEAILERARAGAAIRILLNSDDVFHQSPEPKDFKFFDFDPSSAGRDNATTMDVLNQISGREGLKLQVRLFDFHGCGMNVLHNKGMIVDDNVTLVGSVNWGESPMKFNREAGVLLKSAAVAGYYSKAFEGDWLCSEPKTP